MVNRISVDRADKSSGEFEFLCDVASCKASFDGEGTFQEVWSDAKDNGWRSFKNDADEWEHRCPDHVGYER